MANELRVTGYREFLRACARTEPATRKFVRARFRKVGEIVRVRADALLESKAPVSASGYRVRVRQRGIAVEQSLRKTTGKHPEWGAYQMRHALIPARSESLPDLDREMEEALDDIADYFDK